MSRLTSLLVVFVLIGAVPRSGAAQDRALASHHAHGHAAAASAPPRVAHVPRTPRPPTVDGHMAPEEWAGAVRLDGFVQREPDEGAPASEATEVWVARDDARLYVAFRAWDRTMAQVRAVHTPRDQIAAAADLVGIWIDPLRTGTRAFAFQFNPLGVQYDGIWSRQWDPSWDGVVESAGALAADHFTVEIALPLATLVAGSSPDTWAVNFSRTIGRRSEDNWWAPLSRARRTAMLSEFGALAGMQSARAGARIEAIPTFVSAAAAGGGQSAAWSHDAGLTARAGLGSSTRVDATINPDFSFVEADTAQIAANERWALFYPEKRPFFLDGADQLTTPPANFVSDPLRLVHTRTIVRPRAGVRLTAAPAGTFVGAIWTTQDRFDGAADGSSAVLRVLRQHRTSSQAGFTLTHRDRPGGLRNTVAAADAQLRLGGQVTTTAQIAASRTMDPDGEARGAVAGYFDIARNTGESFLELALRAIPADFQTDIGFVPRRDLLQSVAHAGRYWRRTGGPTQWVNPMLQVVSSWDAAGRFSDLEWLPHIETQFTRDTNVWIGQRIRAERFRDRTHHMSRFEGRMRSRPHPRLDIGTGVKAGTRLRYDTDLAATDRSTVVTFVEWQGSTEFRVGRSGSVSATLIRQFLGDAPEMPAQRLWLVRTRAAWHFDNATYVRLLVQHDPDRRRWAESLVLGYERDYGTQFHVGVERGWDFADGPGAGSDRLRVFARASYRFAVR